MASILFTRREILKLAAAGGLSGAALGGLKLYEDRRSGPGALPVLYVSHGSPLVALDDDDYTRSLVRFGRAVGRPSAIVVLSAHYQTSPVIGVTAGARPPLIYDFGGFPPVMYQLTYPSPGAPELAARIAEKLNAVGAPAALDERRGLDHGAWVPLRLAFPAADVPVVEIALPRRRAPGDLIRMGLALAPLRRENVLLIGSGGIVHNLGLVAFEEKHAPVEPWAAAFDGWVRDRLEPLDVEALVDYASRAPHADLAVPTSEHFDPLFFVLGAALEGDRVEDLYQGIHHGTLSMRTFALRG